MEPQVCTGRNLNNLRGSFRTFDSIWSALKALMVRIWMEGKIRALYPLCGIRDRFTAD
jgi:hypothetical protein